MDQVVICIIGPRCCIKSSALPARARRTRTPAHAATALEQLIAAIKAAIMLRPTACVREHAMTWSSLHCHRLLRQR